MARESIKSLLIVGIVFTPIFVFASWASTDPDSVVWAARIILPIFLIACLVAWIRLALQKDLAPDFLIKTNRNYFNCEGLCFVFRTVVKNNVVHFVADFQNQFSNPVHARLTLVPTRRFFVSKLDLAALEFPVDCPAGGYGSSSLPLAIPSKLRGKCVNFAIGAEVEFPDGKGQRLRFRDGFLIRQGESNSVMPSIVMFLAGLFCGRLFVRNPNIFSAFLTDLAAETLPDDAHQSLEIHWKMGDTVPQVTASSPTYATNVFRAPHPALHTTTP